MLYLLHNIKVPQLTRLSVHWGVLTCVLSVGSTGNAEIRVQLKLGLALILREATLDSEGRENVVCENPHLDPGKTIRHSSVCLGVLVRVLVSELQLPRLKASCRLHNVLSPAALSRAAGRKPGNQENELAF